MTTNPDPEFILRNFQVKPSPVKSICLTDNNELLVADSDGVVKLWDLKTRRIKTSFRAATSNQPITALRLCNNTLITQTKDGVTVWNQSPQTGAGSEHEFQQIDLIDSIGVTFCPCEINHHDDATILCIPGQRQSTMYIRNIITRQQIILEADGQFGMCMSAQFISSLAAASDRSSLAAAGDRSSLATVSEKRMILIGYESGHLLLWDYSSNEIISSTKLHQESLLCFDFHNGLMKGLSGSTDNRLISWTIDAMTRTLVVRSEIKITNPGVNTVKIRRDGRIFVTGGWDKNIRIFNTRKMKQLAVLSFHKQPINCVLFHKDNSVIVGSEDGQISVWSIYK
ncbi:guanine nucleotide-binding protein subunit beta-like protein 1 [Tubulanus polymorphus]|uniref:guanine nucleotide-binding protein subunit beta-like protein 1 n=1 Tax=Tubulanus polymorphus TaxID=672921 RepID=UPI003DA3B4FE